MSGAPDCTEEGMTLVRATIRWFEKVIFTYEYKGWLDLIDLGELLLALELRCNYWASV